MRARAAAAAIIVVAAIVLAGCAANEVTDQYRRGDAKGFIAGSFRVVEIAPPQRTRPVVFAGVLDSGARVSSADYRGKVLVVNFWFAACAPCRLEAPRLDKADAELAPEGVAFLGVNTYDQAATALAFARTYKVPYPSVIDVNDKQVSAAFAESAPLSATPTTLVLDRRGRVAARVIGAIPDASVLTAVARDVLAERS